MTYYRGNHETRPCQVEGCSNLGDPVKLKPNGKYYRRKFCSVHKREHYGMQPPTTGTTTAFKERIRKQRGNLCERCGWVGPCDIHRIIPGCRGGRYQEGNIEIICPNCHRLEHRRRGRATSGAAQPQG